MLLCYFGSRLIRLTHGNSKIYRTMETRWYVNTNHWCVKGKSKCTSNTLSYLYNSYQKNACNSMLWVLPLIRLISMQIISYFIVLDKTIQISLHLNNSFVIIFNDKILMHYENCIVSITVAWTNSNLVGHNWLLQMYENYSIIAYVSINSKP